MMTVKKPTIADEIIEESSRKTGFACQLSRFLRTRSKDDAREFMASVNDKAINGAAVWRVLFRYGYAGGQHTIVMHRNFTCSYCARLAKELK
jgi:hypothetical protein